MNKRLLLVLPMIASGAATAFGQSPAAMDSLLQRLAGTWDMTATVRGQKAKQWLRVDRVLKNRFVRLHILDLGTPPAYEALVFIGVDSVGERYIAHWMDDFGAAYSIPPGTGRAHGDTIFLDFPYPDGPFYDTFTYDRKANTWHFLLESADSAGKRKVFATYDLKRRR